MEKNAKIYVAGHRGMVGSSIVRHLQQLGYTNILTSLSKDVDLRNQHQVMSFFYKEKPDYVFLAAAKVGGIYANNTFRAEFLYDNLMIEANVIHASYLNKCKKLMFLGSSCIYPKMAPQPLKESYLLTGPLEYTNEPYAIAKIAGIKLCESYRLQYGCNFISVMPTNLYGPNDNYDLNKSHVLPALLRKIHTAKIKNIPTVEVWGSGAPLREFLHVDDLAEACLFLMENYHEAELVNIGTGTDISIKDLAMLIMKVADYKGEIKFDSSKPDGTPRKLMDVGKLTALGWKARISLEEGIGRVYKDVEKMNFDQ
ncbi:MAG TPA: GDP-L-fucose synthase [Bacteroidia bacterium]|nr:GDP-L-fucose synthase [Bacteroidia bacterium]